MIIKKKKILVQNGFKFEFYGIYDNGTSYYPNNDTYNDAFKGFFCYWDGRENIQATLRFGIRNQKNILWNAGDGNYVSDYSFSTTYPWNIMYPENDGVQAKKEVHFTISVDCSQKEYVHTMYINGNKTYAGKLNKEYWEYFVNKYLDSLKYFCVGRSSMGTGGRWHYSKMNAYSIKLYNRGLNEQEVKENYDKSVAYHNLLQK